MSRQVHAPSSKRFQSSVRTVCQGLRNPGNSSDSQQRNLAKSLAADDAVDRVGTPVSDFGSGGSGFESLRARQWIPRGVMGRARLRKDLVEPPTPELLGRHQPAPGGSVIQDDFDGVYCGQGPSGEVGGYSPVLRDHIRR